MSDEWYEETSYGFKPCYKWITFNIMAKFGTIKTDEEVLNLVINGLPSIFEIISNTSTCIYRVLNLVINGLPSISLS